MSKRNIILPIGISDFGKLIRQRDSENKKYTFIDKSLLIKDFIDKCEEATLITRPRRFGKTMALSMLQHFFAAEVDGISTKGLFDGLKISKHPKIMALQGTKPVIFISLRKVGGKTFEQAYNLFRNEITKLYKAHSYLLKSEKVVKSSKK